MRVLSRIFAFTALFFLLLDIYNRISGIRLGLLTVKDLAQFAENALSNLDIAHPAYLYPKLDYVPAFGGALVLSICLRTLSNLLRLAFGALRKGEAKPTPADGDAGSSQPVVSSASRKNGGIQAGRPRDTEFLPAALEILVTPPSPVAISLMVLIASIVVSGLVWAFFGKIDVYAVAIGKIQAVGRSKVVQPLDAGKVAAIHVRNGDAVAPGDVVIELDSTEAAAEREAQALEFESAAAECQRRKAVIESVFSNAFTIKSIAFPPQAGLVVRLREQNAAEADLSELKSTVDNLKAQVAEKDAQKKRLEASIQARSRLISLYEEHLGMREKLGVTGAASRAQIIEIQQSLESQRTTDVSEKGQLIEADAAIASLASKIDLTLSQFISQQTQKLVEAERKRDKAEQDLIKAASKRDRATLRATVGGTVQQLKVTHPGQVVSGGQPLMIIVPFDSKMEIEATVANKDIGFVKKGQDAVVKVESFPFTRYGVIPARVLNVSRDAVDEREALTLTDPATAARSQTGSSDSGRTPALVYPVTMELERNTIMIEGQEVPLTMGMTVTVEIKTDTRKVIDYVLSPLREVVSQAGHER